MKPCLSLFSFDCFTILWYSGIGGNLLVWFFTQTHYAITGPGTATSISTGIGTSSKIEYIIPQMVLSSLKKFGIDGVSYCSTKFDGNDLDSVYLNTNFTFPAYNNSKSEYSVSLSKFFSVSKPLAYDDILNGKLQMQPEELNRCRLFDPFNKLYYLAKINGEKYLHTDYYIYEKLLENKCTYNVFS